MRQEGGLTTQTLAPSVRLCSVADAVYSLDRLPTDDRGRAALAPSRILAGADSDPWLLTREFVDRVAGDLLRGRLLRLVGFGEPESHLAKSVEFGGQA